MVATAAKEASTQDSVKALNTCENVTFKVTTIKKGIFKCSYKLQLIKRLKY